MLQHRITNTHLTLNREINDNYIVDEKERRIAEIEYLTGLNNLNEAFEDSDGFTEVELLVLYLINKYDIDYLDNPRDYFVRVIGLSPLALESINANDEEFYYNMTNLEALTLIITNLISNKGIKSKGGFPSIFNFKKSQSNISQNYSGKKWFPYTNNDNNLNHEELLIEIIRNINTDNARIMYHGTSWGNALSIMNKIEIRPRQTTTDFGMRNFYLTNTFKTACKWATRHSPRQAAVVVFVIPHDYIDSIENHLMLNDIGQWKETVFKIRNRPEFDIGNDALEYRRFIHEIDSHDLISGPIFSNPGVETVDEVACIKYGNYIPYQYSFKDSTIDALNGMLAITLFFKEV